jgi:hypothetical protein
MLISSGDLLLVDADAFFGVRTAVLIAGKPGSHRWVVSPVVMSDTTPVGAGLARDEAGTYTADFATDGSGRIEHNP